MPINSFSNLSTAVTLNERAKIHFVGKFHCDDCRFELENVVFVSSAEAW